MIYFQAVAGLCNRLLGIISAVAFAEQVKQPLTIVWENQSDCNCNPQKLFSVESDNLKKIIVLPYVDIGIRAEIRKRINLFRINYLINKCDCVEINETFYKNKEILIEKVENNKNIFLSSYSHWWGTEEDLNKLVFNDELNKKASDTRKKCGEKCCGVHIRRTDHDVCIKNSPTDIFVENMSKEPKDTNFYVATDNPKEIDYLIEIFGPKRIFYKRDVILSRDSEEAIKHATEELLTLSKMDKIFGSYGSTFSKVSSIIEHKELCVCKK